MTAAVIEVCVVASDRSYASFLVFLQVVNYNCYGDDYDDIAAALARGLKPRGHVGLWLEFSQLNHSCVPNAINLVIGDAMVCRAVAPIKAGAQRAIHSMELC